MSQPRISAESFQVPASADRLRQRATIAGVVGIVVMLVGLMTNADQFFRSYLVGIFFWTTVALGCLGLLMIHHLSGGGWGLVIRRILEAAASTLPLMGLLFVPLMLGLSHVYEWADPDVVAKDHILQMKAPFLNAPFWILRTVLYFVIWSAMALLLKRWSSEQDASGAGRPLDWRFARLSGPGCVVLGLTITFASFDWLMSVNAHWYSSMYGFLTVGGCGLAALSFIILCIYALLHNEPVGAIIQPKYLHDLGKLTFTFVMLFAYFSFSQFLITWSGNLPEEIPWYLRRYEGGWRIMFVLLVLGHFVLPFSILLSANIKQRLDRLWIVALLLLVMRMLEVIFEVAPFYHETVTIHWLDVAALVGVGGIWVSAFVYLLKGRPLVPVNDPYLREALADHGAH